MQRLRLKNQASKGILESLGTGTRWVANGVVRSPVWEAKKQREDKPTLHIQWGPCHGSLEAMGKS